MIVALVSLPALPASAASVVDTITVGNLPYRVAFTPDGTTAYVTNLNSAVSVIAVDRAAELTAPSALPTPVLGTPFSFTVPVSVGSPAATFSISAGALPAGFVLDETTGVISGTPTTAGAFSFTVAATNSSGTVSATYTDTIAPQLAPTGANSTPLIGMAMALALVGAALVLIRRRARAVASGS
ncbi:MAG: Ig domain-containing protein [Microbacteriaceae bacterium]|nr:Ig domain-containing protein [Microbacteriaceae bacterium]